MSQNRVGYTEAINFRCLEDLEKTYSMDIMNPLANVKHFFTSLGNEFFTSYGKQFFTLYGKKIFTLFGKQIFTFPGKEFFTSPVR